MIFNKYVSPSSKEPSSSSAKTIDDDDDDRWEKRRALITSALNWCPCPTGLTYPHVTWLGKPPFSCCGQNHFFLNKPALSHGPDIPSYEMVTPSVLHFSHVPIPSLWIYIATLVGAFSKSININLILSCVWNTGFHLLRRKACQDLIQMTKP